jgi:hypothetical protein
MGNRMVSCRYQVSMTGIPVTTKHERADSRGIVFSMTSASFLAISLKTRILGGGRHKARRRAKATAFTLS